MEWCIFRVDILKNIRSSYTIKPYSWWSVCKPFPCIQKWFCHPRFTWHSWSCPPVLWLSSSCLADSATASRSVIPGHRRWSEDSSNFPFTWSIPAFVFYVKSIWLWILPIHSKVIRQYRDSTTSSLYKLISDHYWYNIIFFRTATIHLCALFVNGGISSYSSRQAGVMIPLELLGQRKGNAP